MSSTRIAPCVRCAAPVTREMLPDGHPLIKLNSLPFWCDACIEADREEKLQEDERHAEQSRQLAISERLKVSGLPKKYHDCHLASLDHPKPTLQAALRWAENGGGLLLTGEIGRGKTTIAGAAAMLRLQHERVTWTSAPLLFARLGTGLGSDQRQWALDLLSARSALVLDDIDKARPTEYGAEQVFLAVDQRVEHEAPLLVTSNLAPSQLAEKWPEPYGPAIASRLVGYCTVLEVQGFDRRLRAVS